MDLRPTLVEWGVMDRDKALLCATLVWTDCDFSLNDAWNAICISDPIRTRAIRMGYAADWNSAHVNDEEQYRWVGPGEFQMLPYKCYSQDGRFQFVFTYWGHLRLRTLIFGRGTRTALTYRAISYINVWVEVAP